ncbi:MAG: dodecin domain-containing protein [Acidimicrobiales bacterium]
MSDEATAPAGAESEHTYRVIRLIGTSDRSWEDAARNGVAEAAKTITTLHHARVTDADTIVRHGAVALYRLELELSFQLDRTRIDGDHGERPVTVQRYLIVANQTLAGDRIPMLVAERAASAPSEFHILVPATRSRETRQLTAVAGDPLSGYAVVDVVGLDEAIAQDHLDAEARLATFTDRLDRLGVVYTSEVGASDPFQAIAHVMERASFDEIIISTLASGVSRWLRMDLPSRVKRAYALPVITITIEG